MQNNYILQDNKTIWISMFDAEKSLVNRIKYRVYEILESAESTFFHLDFEIFDPQGNSAGKFSSRGQFLGTKRSADYHILIPQNIETMEGTTNIECQYANNLEYPEDMDAGEKLPDGKTCSEIRYNDVFQKTEAMVTNRKVISRDRLKTNYGEKPCLKIISDVIVLSTEKILPESFEMTEWFSPKQGILKMESPFGGMEIDYFGESSGLN